MSYTELQVTTNFSFLRGGSHPEELIEQAAVYGYREIAITDHNTLAGIVRAYAASKTKNIRVITGCHLDVIDGVSLLAYPTNKDAYAELCALLTTGNMRTEKGKCDLCKADVYKHAKGIKFIVIPPTSLVVAGNPVNKDLWVDVEDINTAESFFDENKETILIVEDNITMINYLLKKLRWNYNVYAALNGNEALKKIKSLKVKPDLIISDVMMDKVDGYTFAKIISKDPVYSHIPIMFLSAKSAKTDKLQGLKLGAIDFIQKPFSIQELNQKIESVLAHERKRKKILLNIAFTAISNSRNLESEDNENAFEQNCQRYSLTSREKDIAKLICEGYKYKEIGEKLFISERTVTKHVQNIFEKVDVSNKIELINKLDS